MLKSRFIELGGKDEGVMIYLVELPALVADRAARALLLQLSEDPDGGIAALAFRHSKRATAQGPEALLPFVKARSADDRPLDVRRDIRDWRNIERLQQSALLLHVDFLLSRESIEVPVRLQGEQLLAGTADTRVTFCSPQIAAVLDSKMATYHELETVLSTEDVFNLAEIISVSAIRDWHASQRQT